MDEPVDTTPPEYHEIPTGTEFLVVIGSSFSLWRKGTDLRDVLLVRVDGEQTGGGAVEGGSWHESVEFYVPTSEQLDALLMAATHGVSKDRWQALCRKVAADA